MADEVLNISLQADISALTAELARLGPEGDKEAKKMVAALQRQYSKAEKAAKSSSKASAAAFAGDMSKIEGAGAALASAMGGSFGAIGGFAQSALKPLAEIGLTLGPAGVVGVGAAAAAVSLALVGTTVVSLADAAIEARDRLIEAGDAALIPPESLRSLQDYETTSSELRQELDLLSVTVGGALADDLAILVHTTAELVRWTREAGETTSDWGGFLLEVAGNLHPAIGAAIELGQATYTVADAQTKAAISAREWVDSETEALIALGMLDEELERTTPIRVASIQAVDEASLESAAIREELLARLVALDDEEVASSQRVREAMLDANADVLASRANYHGQYLAMLQSEGAAIATRTEQERASAEAIQGFWLGLADQGLTAFGSIADAVADSYADRTSAGAQMTEKDKQAARTSIEIAQSVAEIQAALQAAIVGVGVAANLASAMGPFALVAGAAAGAAAFTTAMVSIESAPSPEFPMGFAPPEFPGGRGTSTDHHLVGIQDDEGIASRRAMADPELRRMLADANRGVAAPSGGSTDVGVTLDPRLQRLRITVDRKLGKRPRRGR